MMILDATSIEYEDLDPSLPPQPSKSNVLYFFKGRLPSSNNNVLGMGIGLDEAAQCRNFTERTKINWHSRHAFWGIFIVDGTANVKHGCGLGRECRGRVSVGARSQPKTRSAIADSDQVKWILTLKRLPFEAYN